MTSQEHDPRTGRDALEEPDFAEEHDEPTFADEQGGRPGMEPDESVPSDLGGDDPKTPIE